MESSQGKSQPDDRGLSLNFLEAEEIPLPCSRANLLGRLPRFGMLEIRIPEGPRSTLPRTDRVNRAAAGLGMEKCAIARGEFLEARSLAHRPGVLGLHFVYRFADEFCDLHDLFFIDPDVPLWPRAAVAALCALEPQSVLVPLFVAHGRIVSRRVERGNVPLIFECVRNDCLAACGEVYMRLLAAWRRRVQLRKVLGCTSPLNAR